jgi:hypothetical protein
MPRPRATHVPPRVKRQYDLHQPFYEQLVWLATEDARSLTATIEWLILEEIKRRLKHRRKEDRT